MSRPLPPPPFEPPLPPAPAHPPGKGPVNKVLAGVVGVAVAIVVVVVSVNNSLSGGSGSAGGGATTALPSFSVPVVPPTESIQVKVYNWFQGVMTDFNAVETDQGEIGKAAATGDPSVLGPVCVSLKSDVQTFEADPPAPDSVIRAALARAMDFYSTSATECIAGNYTAAAADSGRGTAWITRASARIKQLSR